MILLIDNYDSFTFNLFQYISELGFVCKVIRNDECSVSQIMRMKPRKIVISPGPGTPDAAGVSLEVIKKLSGKIPILGVCLGHQAIGQAFGSKVIRAPKLMHGKVSNIFHNNKSSLYKKVPSPFVATRYHSLIVDHQTLGPDLEVTSRTEDGIIMGLRHKKFDVEGVQFHPESVMTKHGKTLLSNFLSRKARAR